MSSPSPPYSGGTVLADVGWYEANAGGTTHPGCGKARNGYQLCDLTGNVTEWTWDRREAYTGAALTDPTGSTSNSYRVVRGGAYHTVPQTHRTSHHLWNTPTQTSHHIGFRLVRNGP